MFLCAAWMLALGAGCMAAQEQLKFPMKEVVQTTQEVESLGSDVRKALSDVEYDMRRAFGDIPEDAIEVHALHAVRYALMWCFTAPICEPGDEKPVCKRRMQRRDVAVEARVGLDGRAPVYGYIACDLPSSSNFVAAVDDWTPEHVEWFRDRVFLIDRLRVRLKAQIPARLNELDIQVANYRVDLQQLNKRALDRWREAQRVEKRADQRRGDEERWTRFREEALRLEESITLIGLDLERLRGHQRHDVRQIAIRLATLGATGF